MDVHGIQRRIRALIAGLARVDEGFDAQLDVFRELPLEPADALDLLLQIEEEFEIAIDDEAFGATRTLERMSALVAALRGVIA